MEATSSWNALRITTRDQQNKIVQYLRYGSLPLEEEIYLRETLYSRLLQCFRKLGHLEDLRDAIIHIAYITGRLREPSHQRATFLGKLCELKIAASKTTEAPNDLDEAVGYGKQARDEADPTKKDDLCDILHHLGIATSYRFQSHGSDDDLDECIACAREALNLTPRESHFYLQTSHNLATRIAIRYKKHHDPADLKETTDYVEQKLAVGIDEPFMHGAVLALQCEISHEKYIVNGELADLDSAIASLDQAIKSMESSPQTINHKRLQMSSFYVERYRKTANKEDILAAIEWSASTLDATPAKYPARPKYILSHLSLLQYVPFEGLSVTEVSELCENAFRLWQEIPSNHTDWWSSGEHLCEVMVEKYVHTHEIADLRSVVSHTMNVYSTSTKTSEQQRTTGITNLREAFRHLCKIAAAEADGCTKTDINEQIFEYFDPFYELDSAYESVDSFCQAHSNDLRNLAEESEMSDNLTKAYDAPPDSSRKADLSNQEIFNRICGYGPNEPTSMDDFIRRERQLEQEALERDEQRGEKPSPDLCRFCRGIKILVPLGNDCFRWTNDLSVPLGTLQHIRCRQAFCSVCRLIHELIMTGKEKDRLHPRLSSLSLENQEVTLHHEWLPTREKMLGVKYGTSYVGSLRILQQANWPSCARQGWQIGALDQTQTVNHAQLRTWLSDCHTKHGDTCNKFWNGSQEPVAISVPILLYDVIECCLVRATSAAKYFALSYVWGKVNNPNTYRSNLEERMKAQAFKTTVLPKTISDAATLVLDLGERYLWTDALCIVQDDAQQKHEDIQRMDVVYNQAFATIAAVHGADANGGLPGVKPETRPRQRIINLRMPSLEVKDKKSDVGNAEPVMGIISTPSPLDLELEVSTWIQRGWVLQEHLLSRRILYFSTDYVYFQCTKQTTCEVVLHGMYKTAETEPAQPLEDKLQNPLNRLRDVSVETAPMRKYQIFSIYGRLVELYTQRTLSHQSDIVNAFTGVLNVLARYSNGVSLQGMPAGLLDLALLWTPASSISRSGSKPGSKADTADGKLNKPNSDLQFPSWSWAGWKGSIQYRIPLSSNEPLPTPSIRQLRIGSEHDLQPVIALTACAVDHTQLPEEAETQDITDYLVQQMAKLSTTPSPTKSLNVLSFIARTVPATAFMPNTSDRQRDYLSSSPHTKSACAQSVLRLKDLQDRHCGLWYDHGEYMCATANVESDATDYLWLTQKMYHYIGKGLGTDWKDDEVKHSRQRFIEISRLEPRRRSSGKRKGLNGIDVEVPFFDEDAFPAVGAESGIVNCLVVEWGEDIDSVQEGSICERVALAQIHERAWKDAKPVEMVINLS